MSHKTAGVQRLIAGVVTGHAATHLPDITEQVFHDIERNATWRARYEALASLLGVTVTNQAIGRCVRDAVNGVAVRQVATTRTTLAASYSVLRY